MLINIDIRILPFGQAKLEIGKPFPSTEERSIKKIERLKELGHLIRRPEADYLRGEIDV